MSLDIKIIKSDRKSRRPEIVCCSNKHFEKWKPVPFEDIKICKIQNCYCNYINGWNAVCAECGLIMHNCPFGCKKGITVLKERTEKKRADLMEDYNCLELMHHIYTYHKDEELIVDV